MLRFAYEHLGEIIIMADGGFYPFSICSVYGEIIKDAQGIYHLTGEQRTGCMYCAFGVTEEAEPNRFQRMQTTHPKHYDLCMRSLESGGLGMKAVLQYMHVPYETWESVGQMKFDFSEESAENAA